MAVGDIIQFTLKGSLNGAKTANVYHYEVKIQDDLAVDPAITFLPLFRDTLIENELLNMLSDEVLLSCTEARVISPSGGPPFVEFFSLNGLVASPALPAANCYKYRLYTSVLNRRGRGRKYISGVPQSYHDRGNVTDFGRANVLDFQVALNLDLEDAGPLNQATPVVWSPTTPGSSEINYARASMKIWNLRSRQQQIC